MPPAQTVVIDVDPRNRGASNLLAETRTHGALSPTLTAATGGGGLHAWYRWTSVGRSGHAKRVGQHPSSTRGAQWARLTGVDVITGPGRYVVAPPSRHASGGRYGWITDLPVAEVPVWLRRPDDPGSSERNSINRAADLSGLVRTVHNAAEGNRNNALYWAACRAFTDGNDLLIPDLADAGTLVGLDQAEVSRTIESARRKAA